MADKPFSDEELKGKIDAKKRLLDDPHVASRMKEAVSECDCFLATIAADRKRIETLNIEADLQHHGEKQLNLQLQVATKTIERLRGVLTEADELLQRHDAGQLHNDHYKGHVLQKDTVAFFARQTLKEG